jgi:hypothetical protein
MKTRVLTHGCRIVTSCLIAVWLLACGTGCQTYARIAWDPPKPMEGRQKQVLIVGDLAQLRRQAQLYESDPDEACIGKHTFTVFALPVGDIHPRSNTPIKQSFDHAIRTALTAAGYELSEAAAGSPDSPVLRGEVNACWWWSYSYFWPVVVQGGENKVTLYLEDRAGTVLWKKQFSRIEPGIGGGGAYGFDLMIKWSMTKLLQDIVQETSSDTFMAALARKH